MRRALVLSALFACAGSPESGQRFITIDSDAVATAQALGHATVEELDKGVAVLAIDASELDALTQAMHEQHQRCGGFMLHESLADAQAAARAPEAKPAAAIDYRLDRAAAVKAVLPTIEAKRILGTIGELSAMKNRYYRSESGAAASAWLRDRWRKLANRPEITVELFDQGYPQKSVIMTVPGTTRPDEVVVIGGHLDSIARGGTAANAPGADDDASGIATIDEVVRALMASNFRPERTVQFMAYAAEEVGLRGSQAIVREYKKRGVNVVGALQLDMTNYQGSDRDIWIIDDHTSAAQNAFLIALIETYTDATWGVDRCGYACSDHASWNRAGVPASMPFEARFRESNRSIHTAEDTLERSNNNAQHAAKFARLAAAYAIELAKGDVGRAAVAAQPERETHVPWMWLLLGLGGLIAVWRIRKR